MELTWGVQIRTKASQSVCGDGYMVINTSTGWLLSVIDGLGGGEEAAKPTALALAVLKEHAERPLKDLIQRCHTALHGTRGAVIGLMRIEAKKQHLTYVGVGNIGVHALSRHSIKPISKNGILGHRQLPSLLEMAYEFDPGDTFILYSDGISTRMISDAVFTQPIENLDSLALDLLERYGKTSDDATILIARPH